MLLSLFATLVLGRPAAVPDTARLAPICRRFVGLDGAGVWPGYRPESLSVAFVVLGRGTLLCNWRGAPPEGFVAARWRLMSPT